jgi:hypothetical protein
LGLCADTVRKIVEPIVGEIEYGIAHGHPFSAAISYLMMKLCPARPVIRSFGRRGIPAG